MIYLLFLGVIPFGLLLWRQRPGRRWLKRARGSAIPNCLATVNQPVDDAFTIAFSDQPQQLADFEELTQFLRSSRRRLSERHAEKLLKSDKSPDLVKAEFDAAWKRITAIASSKYGGYMCGKAIMRLGY